MSDNPTPIELQQLNARPRAATERVLAAPRTEPDVAVLFRSLSLSKGHPVPVPELVEGTTPRRGP